MTLKQAERINGCRYEEVERGLWHAYEGDVLVATARGKALKRILKELVEEVYRRNRVAAMIRDEYRCRRCGSVANLQANHIAHRGSQGRNDRIENLETICADCHRREHGG